MKILNSLGKPIKSYKRVPRCPICKRNLDWKYRNGKWIPYLLTGEQDICFNEKK